MSKNIFLHFSGLLSIFLLAAFLQLHGMPAPLPVPPPGLHETLEQVEALNASQEYERSLDLLLREFQKNPNNISLKTSLNKTFALYLYDQVSKNKKRIDVNIHDVQAYLNLARAYATGGDYFRAMEVLTNGFMENPNSTSLLVGIGTLELKEKRENEAFSIFRKVLELDEQNAPAHNNIGFLLSRKENEARYNLTEALHHAKKAVALEPTNPNFLDTLADIQFQQGHPTQAIELIQQAIQLAPQEDYFKNQLLRFQTAAQSVAQ